MRARRSALATQTPKRRAGLQGELLALVPVGRSTPSPKQNTDSRCPSPAARSICGPQRLQGNPEEGQAGKSPEPHHLRHLDAAAAPPAHTSTRSAGGKHPATTRPGSRRSPRPARSASPDHRSHAEGCGTHVQPRLDNTVTVVGSRSGHLLHVGGPAAPQHVEQEAAHSLPPEPPSKQPGSPQARERSPKST